MARIADQYPQTEIAEVLNNLKNLGFHWAAQAGVTVSIQDLLKPPLKQKILDDFEKRAEKVESQFRRGIITDDERRQELIEIWTEATERVREDMEDRFRREPFNPFWVMVSSGARGNMTQVRQIAGMRGLVANPKGEIIPRPIKANFREGLSVLEYFISTHGARKGLADTALRTADSGYLTRRLVDVTQDVIVRESNCGTERGIPVTTAVQQPVPGKKGEFQWVRPRAIESQALFRITAEPVTIGSGKREQVLFEAGTEIDEPVIQSLIEHGIEEVLCRSVLTCDSKVGVCQFCYGRSLASNRLVDIGEAVGIIAAQSIGEPGTQLTMRTFHTGGIAGEDITHGLPRVQELFEARTPKGMTPIAEFSGRVSIEQVEKGVQVTVTSDEGEEWVAIVPRRARLRVQDGQEIEVGQPIIEGIPNPKEMLRVLGIRATQRHLVDEVQKVYTSQGVTIHDKHIELIVRQMLKRVTVLEGGDTELLPGELVERATFEQANREALERGGDPGQRPARAARHHQGVAGHRVVAVGGLLPGDHPGADRGGHRGQERLADRPQGERHHRQADPGRDRHGALPQRDPGADRDPRGRLRGRRLRRRLRDLQRRRLLRRGRDRLPGPGRHATAEPDRRAGRRGRRGLHRPTTTRPSRTSSSPRVTAPPIRTARAPTGPGRSAFGGRVLASGSGSGRGLGLHPRTWGRSGPRLARWSVVGPHALAWHAQAS